MRKRLTVVLATLALLFGGLTIASPAQADSLAEMQAGCDHGWLQMFPAGYYHTVNGVQYGVYKTPGNPTGGSWSNCEDINVGPNVAAGYFMTSAYARTYMCPSSGAPCFFNAWRWCGGGCVTATNMANGIWYEVHIAFISVGTDYLEIWD